MLTVNLCAMTSANVIGILIDLLEEVFGGIADLMDALEF